MLCGFFFWGYIKDIVYVPPLLKTIEKLKKQISYALMNIDAIMLQHLWNELNYRLDVCRVTKEARIENF